MSKHPKEARGMHEYLSSMQAWTNEHHQIVEEAKSLKNPWAAKAGETHAVDEFKRFFGWWVSCMQTEHYDRAIEFAESYERLAREEYEAAEIKLRMWKALGEYASLVKDRVLGV